MLKCRLCGSEDNHQEYWVKEMMFGCPEKFLYFQCVACSCLQLANLPASLKKYYPKNYYSFKISPQKIFRNPVKNLIKRFLNNFYLMNFRRLGKLNFPADWIIKIFLPADLTKQSKILDIGCGVGVELYTLRSAGFKNLLGLDPYLKQDIIYPSGLTIKKQDLNEISGQWDIIFFNHSLEHIYDQHKTLAHVSALLAARGTAVVRLPLVGYAWERYRENWVQLDAPRHLYLHSLKSFEKICQENNLKIKKIVFDSTAFQFWGSEQYLCGISLEAENSYLNNPLKSIFSEEEIKSFIAQAAKLNMEQRGDQAIFYLKK